MTSERAVDGEWSYDEEHHWLVFTEAQGASAIIAFDVQPQWAARLLAAARGEPPEPGPAIDLEPFSESVRRRAREKAGTRSVRDNAVQIGMGHMVFWQFLRGRNITSRNLDKVITWLAE